MIALEMVPFLGMCAAGTLVFILGIWRIWGKLAIFGLQAIILNLMDIISTLLPEIVFVLQMVASVGLLSPSAAWQTSYI